LVGAASICFPEVDEDDSELNTKITHDSFVPTILLRLLKMDCEDDGWQGCKAILLGGAAIPRTLIEKAKELNLPIHTTYGLTELCSQVATDGKVLPYRELMIAGDGEILVKGKTLFKGYLREGKIELPVDANGYFATGDIGRFDADGNLQITGRKDLMFISGGENIYPEQIEWALYKIDNIDQAVVVPIDDPEFGQRPVAFIRTCDRTQFDSEHLKALLREKLESFKIPVKFYPMPDAESKKLKPNRQNLLDQLT
jgi:O-succinylbenzoic acid--CoA ligase